MSKWAIAAICFATIVVALVLFYWIRSDKIYAIDGPATKAEVLKVIPLGSSVEFARETMEAKGFTCTMTYNKSYVDDNGAGGYIEYPPADSLYCDSERWAGFLRSKRWQVGLIVKDGKVASVAVGVSINGV
jgi:hypothetical protein